MVIRRRLLALLVPVAVLLAAAIPNILSGNHRGRGYSDQVSYHQRVIETFAAQWPRPDISDYAGVMTPLYHLVLAAVSPAVSGDVKSLQLIGAIFGPLTLVVLGMGVLALVGVRSRASAGLGSLVGCLLVLPLACCMYIWDSTIWLLPDNMAWALVAGILAMCFGPPREAGYAGGRSARLAAAGAMLLVLIGTRQSNIWLAAVIWTWALVMDESAEETMVGVLGDLKPRAARVLVGVLATLPAFALLGYFYMTWGGRFQPPMWDEWYARKWNASALPFVLGLVGLFSVFFAGFWGPAGIELLRRRAWVVIGAGVLGAVLAAAAPSDYDMSMGRYGAIWSIADKFPGVAHRSLLLVGLGGVGGAALACWCAALDFRGRWVLLATLASFGATQLKNPWLYQRYTEPLLLMVFALAAGSVWRREHDERRAGASLGDASVLRFGTVGSRLADMTGRIAMPARFAGPVVLALVLGAMGYATMRSAGEVTPLPEGEIGHPPSARR